MMEHNGICTGGVYGYLRALNGVIAGLPKQKIIAVWDGRRSERRKKLFPEYKGNRAPKDEIEKIRKEEFKKLMNQQMKLLKEKFLPALGVLCCTVQEREADDTIYQICNTFASTEDITIISEDMDLLQLVGMFENISVYRPIAKQRINKTNLKEVVGVSPKQYVYYKALLGDDSDNIPNIPDVGKDTLKKIFEKCSDNDVINEILSIVKTQYDQDIQKGKLPEKVSRPAKVYHNWGMFAKNLELVDLSREIFTHQELTELNSLISNFDAKIYSDYFKSLCFEFGFNSILNDFNYFLIAFSKDILGNIGKSSS